MLWLYVEWRVLRRVWLVLLRQAVHGRAHWRIKWSSCGATCNGDLNGTCDLRTIDLITRRGLSGAGAAECPGGLMSVAG